LLGGDIVMEIVFDDGKKFEAISLAVIDQLGKYVDSIVKKKGEIEANAYILIMHQVFLKFLETLVKRFNKFMFDFALKLEEELSKMDEGDEKDEKE